MMINKSADWEKIGEGRSAKVYKLPGVPRVIKVFHSGKEHAAAAEIAAYEVVGGLEPYYLRMHDYGSNYIVLDFFDGKTIHEMLVEGRFIQESIIKHIDKALAMARQYGLNPKDVHIKNILVQDQTVKLIDLARFSGEGVCTRWEDLKKAYYHLYVNPLFPKKLSAAWIEQIASQYKQGKLWG